MDDLRLVGLSDDGVHLVLESPVDGSRHSLRLDERLHAALRGDRARLGQLQIAIESELRPRDIQARIRAGQSAEEIAADHGLPVDRVSRYEAPILLERVHAAELAQAVPVRRVTDAAATPLGELVRSRLADHGVDEQSEEWDSARRDDGRWLVSLTYESRESTRRATWLFDPMRRTVEPVDDEARWLTDEERAAPGPPPSRRPSKPRLAAVPAAEPDPEVGTHDTVPVPPVPPAPSVPAVPTPAAVPDEAALVEPAEAERPTRTAPRGTGRRRAAVPSWDEILFGAPKDDS